MKVDFVNPGLQYEELKDEIIEIFNEISSSGSYVLGEQVEKFEEKFASYCGTKYAIGIGNGSDALFFSLLALNVTAEDEVITVPNSFVATAWAIANIGAKIVFVDVGEDYNIDVDHIAKAITPKTKAIIPVHLTGRIVEMDSLKQLAEERSIHIVEDAAQAVGATYKGKKSGSFGDTGCFSLHPLKNLHVHGDGGVITTDNKEIYETINKMRNHGLKNRDECEFWGWNSRLDEINAAIANLKLDYLDDWNKRYREIAKIYISELKGVVKTPKIDEHEKPVFHRFIIEHEERDKLQSFLLSRDIHTAINYPIPLHLQQAAKDLNYMKGDFPVTETQSEKILSLPIYPELDDIQIEYVIDSVKEYSKN